MRIAKVLKITQEVERTQEMQIVWRQDPAVNRRTSKLRTRTAVLEMHNVEGRTSGTHSRWKFPRFEIPENQYVDKVIDVTVVSQRQVPTAHTIHRQWRFTWCSLSTQRPTESRDVKTLRTRARVKRRRKAVAAVP